MLLNKTLSPIFDVKTLTDEGQIEGYGSTFGGEPDSYGDVIVKGAYTETLAMHKAKGSMPKMFWQHDTSQPIGGWHEAHEDEKGLFMRGQLNMGVQKGREAHALLKAGNIDGLSIGYVVKEHQVDKNNERIWYLKKLDLFEVSIVSIPANESATVTAAKARDVIALKDRLAAGDQLSVREFEKFLKGLGFTNSQAERAARLHLKGQGEPAQAANDGDAFLRALISN